MPVGFLILSCVSSTAFIFSRFALPTPFHTWHLATRGLQSCSQEGPRLPQYLPRSPKAAPGHPKSAQDDPRMCPGAPQATPRGPKKLPRAHQMGSARPQEAPKRPQEASKAPLGALQAPNASRYLVFRVCVFCSFVLFIYCTSNTGS